MVPGTTVGLSALRAILFDGRVVPHNSDFDLLVLRAVRDSDEYDLPWARRAALTSTVRKQMMRAAKDRKEPKLMPAEVLKNADDETKQTLTATIAEGLTALGARSKIERDLDEARKRILELERELGRRR
jgi:hypothetical protein